MESLFSCSEVPWEAGKRRGDAGIFVLVLSVLGITCLLMFREGSCLVNLQDLLVASKPCA